MGVGDPLIDAFLDHPHLTPRHQTDVVEYLRFMGGISNRGALLQAAMTARSETDAAGYVETSRLLGLYHETREPLTGLLAASHLVLAQSSSRTLVVVLPFDVVYWDDRTADVFSKLAGHASGAGYQRAVVILTGIVSDGQIEHVKNENL